MTASRKTIYRVFAGLITLAAVCLQYWLLVRGLSGPAAVRSTIRFFSFFTILSNLIAASALLVPPLWPSSALGSFLARPSVRTGIAGYTVVVGVVYYLLLVGLSERAGLPLIVEHVLHAVTPPLFLLDWLMFVDKRALDWRAGVASLGFPLVYGAYTLAHGATTGWYPYPFLDVETLGYARVALNMVGLITAYLLLVVAMTFIGKRVGRISGGSAAP